MSLAKEANQHFNIFMLTFKLLSVPLKNMHKIQCTMATLIRNV